MANFISDTQMSTILSRIKAWITANLAGKSIESTAVTNVSLSGLNVQKTIDGTTSTAFTIPSASTSAKGVVKLDSSISATINDNSTSNAPHTRAVASALFNKIDKATNEIRIYKTAGDVTAPSDYIVASNAVSGKSHKFILPEKSGDNNAEYTLATTDDIPAAIVVDSALSSTSAHPVENRVINQELNKKSNLYVDKITIYKVANSADAPKDYISAPNAVSGSANTFKLPSKTGSSREYILATTDDIPAAITIDATPTSGHTSNAVSSAGVYTALQGKLNVSNNNISVSNVSASHLDLTSDGGANITLSNPTSGTSTITGNGSATGNLTITLPSTSGTLATLSDVNDVATRISVVTALPSEGDSRTIYLVAKSPAGSGQNVYNEYVWTGSAFELIGDTAVDLTGYWNSSNLSAMDASDLHDLLDEVFPE